MEKSPRLIGLTGTNGSGKGTAAVFFQDRGFAYLSLSDIIREELVSQKLPPTRDNMIREGNRLRLTFGPDILARRALARVQGPTVIDSIRNPEEILRLRDRKNFILLAIEAPVELRFARVKARGRDESATTLAEFIAKEEQEMSTQPHGQQLQACLELADARITNEGSIPDLFQKLETYL